MVQSLHLLNRSLGCLASLTCRVSMLTCRMCGPFRPAVCQQRDADSALNCALPSLTSCHLMSTKDAAKLHDAVDRQQLPIARQAPFTICLSSNGMLWPCRVASTLERSLLSGGSGALARQQTGSIPELNRHLNEIGRRPSWNFQAKPIAPKEGEKPEVNDLATALSDLPCCDWLQSCCWMAELAASLCSRHTS